MKKPSKNWLIIYKVVGITAIISIFLISVFVTFFLKDIANKRLKKEIKESFGNFYSLSYESSNSSLSWNGINLDFEKVVLQSDTTNKLMMMRYPPIFFKTNAFKVVDINLSGLFFRSIIDIERVTIDQPQLLFFIPKKQNSSKNDSIKNEKLTKSSIDSIHVANFDLTDGSASFLFDKNLSDTLYAGKNVNINMEQLGINLNSAESILRTSKVEQIAFSLKDIMLSPKDSDYKYHLDGINFNDQDELLQCYNMKVISTGDPFQMTLNSKFRKSIFNLTLDTLTFKSTYFDELKNLSIIKGSTLHLANLDMNIVRNKSIPLDETQFKKLFQESLLSLPITIEVDSLYLKNGNINYKVYSNNEVDPSNLMLTNMNASISDLYTQKGNRKVVLVDLKGIIMNAAPFTFEARFPLKDTKNHTYKGYIGSMPFTSLNPLIANLTRIELTEGKINSIYFEGRGDQLKNWGTMRSDFEGLKLKVTDDQNDERWLQSRIGNLLTRNKNRNGKDGLVTPIEYVFERLPYNDHLTLYAGGLANGFALSVLPKSVYKFVMRE
jgi:hypothetical protein